MSDKQLELLSAWLDGGMPEEEMRKWTELSCNDRELQDAWRRYHLIGDALRGNLPNQVDTAFTKRLSLALENEPPILAPRPRRAGISKPLIGIAAAATVAAVAVTVVLQSKPVAPVSERAVPAVADTDSVNWEPLPIATIQWRGERSPSSSRLSSYLLNHNQSKFIAPGVEGVPRYARLVGHEVNQ
jgi:sigma-E factor negative regulatory protein RseA